MVKKANLLELSIVLLSFSQTPQSGIDNQRIGP